MINSFAISLSGSMPWYVVRASGLLAAGALILLIFSGMMMYMGWLYKFIAPLKAWGLHRKLGIVAGVGVATHVIFTFIDKFTDFNIFDVFIPFVSNYKPVTILGVAVGSLGVAFGIVGLYILGMIIFTSLTAIRSKKPHAWKTIHLFSYVLVIFIFVHALMIGTDLKNIYIKIIWFIVNSGLLVLMLYRVRHAGAIKHE